MRKTSDTQQLKGRLVLEDGTTFEGIAAGYPSSTSGEVVFNTGMVGYVESFTDPSYRGQILVMTHPLIGNYGVPKKDFFESERVHIQGLVVSTLHTDAFHYEAKQSLERWLYVNKIPAIVNVDTRAITKKLREKGVMLGKIIIDNKNAGEFADPHTTHLVSKVSCLIPQKYGKGGKKVIAIDCGIKMESIRNFTKRGIHITRVPWDYNFLEEQYDGIFISNGPGDPTQCAQTIQNIQSAMAKKIPIFGICLGMQLMALADGAKTYKLLYGHRSQNQPVREVGTPRSYITSQNHGFAVDERTLPKEWHAWFMNMNDGTLEGIRHKKHPWLAVQFHPEAAPGPHDTEWLFDEFIKLL